MPVRECTLHRMGPVDPARLRLAADRYQTFFAELGEAFAEREDVLTQIGLALLSREHVLMTGPPGTAKSRLAHATIGRILDEESRRPSLFARQFTEGTVQTDLIGPIDFKTLMETGRTEHFTDEGLLGSVHAFLDEVFDGRDMLLRSTLNILHERELKQGSSTKQGQIECAVMTSNRYLSEVLEGSRETLLAFVDRIAFVSFVPRGFGNRSSLGAVIRGQVGGVRPRPLTKSLSVQDLDVLQAATEQVYVADQICELLVDLISRFEREVASAVRADPTFSPTRYLSTRTVVRLGNLLRAVVVHDWAIGQKSRLLTVGRRDLHSLRYSLLSVGPAPEALGHLIESEADPRERRQLGILRSEREIFERCFAELPPGPEQPTPPVSASVPATPKEAAGEPAPQPRQMKLNELLALVTRLSERANLGEPEAERSLAGLRDAVSVLSERLVMHGLYPTNDDVSPRDAIDALARLADELERTDESHRPVAIWLRERALELLRECVVFRFPDAGNGLERALADDVDAALAADQLLRELGNLANLEERLAGAGRSRVQPRDADARWQSAFERIEHELCAIWSESVRRSLDGSGSASPRDLEAMVLALHASLQRMKKTEQELDALGGDGKRLRQRVIGPRLSPFVHAAFERFDTSARTLVAEQVAGALRTLREAELKAAISTSELLDWTASALLRADPEPTKPAEPTYEGYRALRDAEQRIPVTVTLAETCLRLLDDGSASVPKPSELVSSIREQLAKLGDDLKKRIVERDTARILRPIELLERWWEALDQSTKSAGDPNEALLSMVRSRFFHVTRDESALTRFALEARLLSELFPQADLTPVSRRISELDTRTLSRVAQLLHERTEARWSLPRSS